MEQIQLIEPPKLRAVGPTPSRPTSYDSDIQKEAAEKAFPLFQKWLGSDYNPNERDELIDDIAAVLRPNRNDGYKMARELEEAFGWEGDRELIDVCDQAYSCLDDIERKSVKDWISAYEITPRFKVGDAVKVQREYVRKDRPVPSNEPYDGFIATVYDSRGQYSVRIPALGHVTVGEGTYGSILAWEVLEGMNPPVGSNG